MVRYFQQALPIACRGKAGSLVANAARIPPQLFGSAEQNIALLH
jgi:hypothetical protein